MGRGPAGRRAGDAAVIAIRVRGGLIVATVGLCLRISVQRLLGGVGVHTAPEETHLNLGAPFLVLFLLFLVTRRLPVRRVLTGTL